MLILFIILVFIAVIALIALILIQNPKGGGLSSELAGFSSNFLGVQKTTDVLERGTWIFAVLIVLLCLFSAWIIPHTKVDNDETRGDNIINNLDTRIVDTARAKPNIAPILPKEKPAKK